MVGGNTITQEATSMGRKRKKDKQTIEVLVEGRLVKVTLTPPTKPRKSWYAYWKGLITSRSTGHSNYEQAVEAVRNMLQNDGRKSEYADTLMSDEEFEEIQRRHYAKKTDPEARKRADKSLTDCLDAISAFKAISGLNPITLAMPEDCERFQVEAMKLPRDWRRPYQESSSEKDNEPNLLSPSTIHKWSVVLRAAFNRANRNAGKKCVRGVVPAHMLLSENPWTQFSWIEPRKRPLRQFGSQELDSILDYFDRCWPSINFAPSFIKISLWSGARRRELIQLRWNDLRVVENEFHFESTGKHGITRWFRIPVGLYEELKNMKTESPYIFACYGQELKNFHKQRGRKNSSYQVKTNFDPENLGDWMYRQIVKWSKDLPDGAAYLHTFRKTALQFAFSGEHIEQTVARDVSVTPSVMMASYAQSTHQEFRRRSNATYDRLRRSLPMEVAVRYGLEESPRTRLQEQLDLARRQEDWDAVLDLADELKAFDQSP
jgi:integrase